MIMGAAVCQPGDARTCSTAGGAVAALVGSCNRALTRYSTQLLPQPPSAHADGGAQPIQGLAAAARQLLLSFYVANQGAKPEAIVVYRGVQDQGHRGAPDRGAQGEAEWRQALVQAEHSALVEVGGDAGRGARGGGG